QDSLLLDAGIGLLPNVEEHSASLRLGGSLQAFTSDVEEPAVKCAAQAAVLQPSKRKVGAAMRACAPNQPVAALLIAKHHQVLSQEADRLDRPVAAELVHKRGRLPIAAHQSAGGRAPSRAPDEIVLLAAPHDTFQFAFVTFPLKFTGAP